MADRGLDTSGHRSRNLRPDLVTGADLVIGMARSHVREAVAGRARPVGPGVHAEGDRPAGRGAGRSGAGERSTPGWPAWRPVAASTTCSARPTPTTSTTPSAGPAAATSGPPTSSTTSPPASPGSSAASEFLNTGLRRPPRRSRPGPAQGALAGWRRRLPASLLLGVSCAAACRFFVALAAFPVAVAVAAFGLGLGLVGARRAAPAGAGSVIGTPTGGPGGRCGGARRAPPPRRRVGLHPRRRPGAPGVDIHRRFDSGQARAGLLLPDPNLDQRTAAAANPNAHCYDNGSSGERAQAIYARASDHTDQYATIVPYIQKWAAEADAVFNQSAAESGGIRHVRWQTDALCQPTVDHVILSPSGDDDLAHTLAELSTMGYNRADRKYVVWVDANELCGISSYYEDDRSGPDNFNNGNPTAPATVSRIDNGCWGLGEPGGVDRGPRDHARPRLGDADGAALHHPRSLHRRRRPHVLPGRVRRHRQRGLRLRRGGALRLPQGRLLQRLRRPRRLPGHPLEHRPERLPGRHRGGRSRHHRGVDDHRRRPRHETVDLHHLAGCPVAPTDVGPLVDGRRHGHAGQRLPGGQRHRRLRSRGDGEDVRRQRHRRLRQSNRPRTSSSTSRAR